MQSKFCLSNKLVLICVFTQLSPMDQTLLTCVTFPVLQSHLRGTTRCSCNLLKRVVDVMQVKSLGKKAQQGTPRGSPTKPQPIQRSGPLEALNVLQQALS